MDFKPFKEKGYMLERKKKKGCQNKTIRKSEQLEVRIIRKDWFVLFGRRKEMTKRKEDSEEFLSDAKEQY